MRIRVPGSGRWVRAVGIVKHIGVPPPGSRAAAIGVKLLRMTGTDRIDLADSVEAFPPAR
jgi:hypothetical protein